MKKPDLGTVGERVSHTTERAVVGAVTNPLTAAVYATVGVLTNPFKAEPKTARLYYNRRRRYSNFVEDIDKAVRDCPVCDAHLYGVETQYYRGGSTRPLSGTIQERNTFCDDHIKDAFHAQEIITASKPEYKG